MVTSMPPQPPRPSSSAHTYTFSHEPPIKLRPSAHFTDLCLQKRRRDDARTKERTKTLNWSWLSAPLEAKHQQRMTAVAMKCTHSEQRMGLPATNCVYFFLFSTISAGLLDLAPRDGWKAETWRYSRICQVWSVESFFFFFFPSLKHQNFYSSRWPGPEKMIISPRYDDTLTAGS